MQDVTQDTDQYSNSRKYTVPEAAERLSITQDAVRKRITRGTIDHIKDADGRVWVYLDTTKTSRDNDQADDRDELVDALRDQIATLKEHLAGEREANRENRRIIAGLTQRIPTLDSPTVPMRPQEPQEQSGTEPKPKPQPGPRSRLRAAFDALTGRT